MPPDGLSQSPASASLASEVPTPAKPDLIIGPGDYTATATKLASIIAASGVVFNYGGPVQVVGEVGTKPRVVRLTVDRVINLAHRLTRPVVVRSGGLLARTLSDRVAKLYLAGDHLQLPPLKGVTSAPLLSGDGGIRTTAGYDPCTAMWCVAPDVDVPAQPTEEQARAALALLRRRFCTFPFADASTVDRDGLAAVDLATPPGADESAFLVALLTAICRPSLPLVPGVLIAAPMLTGSGTGKGKLVRAIAAVAYGMEPHAFTAGGGQNELEKRIHSALLDASQVLFLDNVNGETLHSDTLASVLSETTVSVRLLGSSRMPQLSPRVFTAVTGNGLSVSEDLARRFLVVKLDAHMEDPEARPFPPGYLARITADRAGLLAAGLTIWRWGRQNQGTLRHGRPMGSFEEWASWVRDPLLTLGCRDPAERVREIKANDPLRRQINEVFACWWKIHGAKPVKAAGLAPEVRGLIDPQRCGRQYVASFLKKYAGTRVNGFELTDQKPVGHYGATTYALQSVEESTAEET